MRLFEVPVLACEDWPTNAHVIAAAAELGVFAEGARVLDMTYGRGGWWSLFRPADLTGHDLYRGDGVDFRRLPYDDASFDVVTFDPPYVERSGRPGRGSAKVDDYLDRYGLDRAPSSFLELWSLIAGGLDEAARVLKPGGKLLVKCMAYQSGRRFRPVPMYVALYLEDLGVELVDELVHRRQTGPGDFGTLHHARRNCSTLLICRRRRRAPRRGTSAAEIRLTQIAGREPGRQEVATS